MAPLRVCVVGAGAIGREFALRHLGPGTGTEVASVVDADEAPKPPKAGKDSAGFRGRTVVRLGKSSRADSFPRSWFVVGCFEGLKGATPGRIAWGVLCCIELVPCFLY